MALVTLQRSPTPSAASSASNSEVSPGPEPPASCGRGSGLRGWGGVLEACVRALRETVGVRVTAGVTPVWVTLGV